MKKTIEAFGTGASYEEAIANAEKELNAPADVDVNKEIVDVQDKKILGIFKNGTVYKARASYEIEVDDAPKVAKKPAEKKASAQEKPKKQEQKKQEVKKAPVEAEEDVAPQGVEEEGPVQDYIKAILKGLKLDNIKVLTEKSEDSVSFQILSEEDYGCVIGRRGETLDAIQYLTRLTVNRGDINYKRVTVNVGNYREKRSNTLTDLAKRNASKVLKYGRNVVLEPMNPFERRVIHTAVQEIENVESYSIGNDEHRRVVIKLVDGAKPTNPSSGRGRSRGGYSGNSSSRRETVPNTNPKSDISGASLYGKIEKRASAGQSEE